MLSAVQLARSGAGECSRALFFLARSLPFPSISNWLLSFPLGECAPASWAWAGQEGQQDASAAHPYSCLLNGTLLPALGCSAFYFLNTQPSLKRWQAESTMHISGCPPSLLVMWIRSPEEGHVSVYP